jgi:hypothetical protein
MKKYILAIIIAFSLWACQKGQKVEQAKVPDPVVQSFYERYPVATDVEWYINGTEYRAEFNYDSDHKKALYRNDGTFLESH